MDYVAPLAGDVAEAAGLRIREAKVVGPLALRVCELGAKDPEDGRGQVGIEGGHTRELTG